MVIGITVLLMLTIVSVVTVIFLQFQKNKMEKEKYLIAATELKILQDEFLWKDCILTELRRIPQDQ